MSLGHEVAPCIPPRWRLREGFSEVVLPLLVAPASPSLIAHCMCRRRGFRWCTFTLPAASSLAPPHGLLSMACSLRRLRRWLNFPGEASSAIFPLYGGFVTTFKGNHRCRRWPVLPPPAATSSASASSMAYFDLLSVMSGFGGLNNKTCIREAGKAQKATSFSTKLTRDGYRKVQQN